MKRYIFAAAAAAMVLAGCAKEENFEKQQPVQGDVLTLEGSTGYDETKVTIGDKTGNQYPLLWYNGDAIGISDVDTLYVKRAVAEVYEGSVGKNMGIFQTTSTVAVDRDVKLVITYPEAYVSYTPAGIRGEVKSMQSQRKAGSMIHVGNNCIAYAMTDLKAGQTEGVQFSLTHKTAFVKVTVSSSEFASAELKSVKIWCPGEKLSGTMTVDPAAGTVALSDTKDYVGVEISQTAALSAAQDVYFTAIPADLSGKETYVIVTLADGVKTIEIPVKVSGKQLKESCLNVIKVENLKLSDNAAPWYNPVETRYVAAYGLGWAYGDQNSYVAKMDGDAVVMDVRARGNFMRCRKPEYLLVHNACELNINNKTNIELNGQNAYDGTAYVKIPLNGNYNVSAKALAAGAYLGYCSKIKLLDGNSDCIWCFNLWGVTTQPEGQTMKNGMIMDRNIGCGVSDIAFKDSARPQDGRGAYFQWGRPFQTGWSSSGGLFVGASTNITDLGMSAAHPETFYHMKDVAPSQGGDWYLGAHTGARNEHVDDLWGNENKSGEFVNQQKGTKSIYDPCPKGWMVACPALLQELYKTAVLDQSDAKMTRMTYTNGDVLVTLSFGGCKWGSNGGNCDNSYGDICALWANSPVSSYEQEGANAYAFYYRVKDGDWSAPEKQSGNRSHGFPVRCMKDDENR